MTALTLLALLGDGNTPVSGPHRETVADGVAWLIGAQDPRSGVIGGAAGHDFIYDHAIATLALAEAWVLSCEDEALKAAAQQAVRYLGKHRNPHAAWRYAMRDGDNDTSVTGWCTLALHTAARGGLEVDERALPCALQWFDRVTEEESGRVGYARRGGRSSRLVGQHATRFPRDRGEVCTAIALYCRELTAPGDHPLRAAQAALVAACPPEWDEERGTIDEYYWFFGSHALFQVGGEAWDEWSRALVEQLPPRQREDGNFAGSWDPRGVWAGVGGRVYTTAMNVLALESFYRDARVTPVQDAPTGEQRVHPGLDGDR